MRFTHGVVPLFLFLCVFLWSFSETVHCQTQTLHPSELKALEKIGVKLGKHWNVTVDPCSGAADWVHPNSNWEVAVNVTCGACKTDYCHVISIVLTSQNLTGSLPAEFSILTSLKVIDLSRNYLNGTIPASWASIPLTNLTLTGNRITGRIPNEFDKITTLQHLSLASNMIEGPLPDSLGNLTNLQLLYLAANNITGTLPKSLVNLKNMTYFSIGGNPITGKFPSFIGKWTQLEHLEMQGTSLEGPFPPLFSTLWKITSLVLRNMSMTDELPLYIGNMTMLRYLFLNNNKLTGAIPDWMSTSGVHIDISYNNFNAPNAPCYCSTGIVNMVSSYSSTDDNSIKPCLRRNNPCSRIATNFNLFINCGGKEIIGGENDYQGDTDNQGASYYNSYGDKWALSSTGYFMGNENQPYIVKNVSQILGASNVSAELYTTARVSPLSLTYYGLCLQNGNYTVNPHFAEIMFTDDQTYSAEGRRFFDVSIQGEKVIRDFNIAKEANGIGRAIIKNFNALVNSNTLEIHLQWAGQGTRNILEWGVYGPLISAISVTPS